MSETPSPHGTFRTEPVSFIRRSGRLSAGQELALERSGGTYVVDVPRAIARTSVDPDYVLDPAAVFGRTAAIVVEIGSGMGECAVAAATARPDVDHLALEVYLPGIAQAVRGAERAGLANLRLLQANAPEVFATALPVASVDEVWIFFPDPWPKARHHKRRLVTPSFVELVARVLKPGGVWRLATDWRPYAEQMIEVISGSDAFAPLVPGSDGTAPRFDGRVLTTFEAKGHRAGREVTDLAYVRTR
ncbi:tRNA (guanine-N(7)-)-methyltransferase [Flavimobilis marinus]|uniref:tRNA (guanine-N(7)-)-methyltransferase n=1 Tax=Flavimobilis marinus TaxID=285351 RepID=A0A1I2DVF3_9MICO|nr:tRNA (guanosine(46)-N7)-methyltransferase TrmB [Flavimobilis marinus]GHG44207.1 tRNA (guanine-N(7)-)-methyltransferase [Flavimobilis marinus]SFE84585.1 tRNA (guanine-N7-)-methyltransferase [Flavimobilis marinus]